MFVRFAMLGDAVVASSGKWTVVGNFNLIWFKEFPASYGQMGILLRLEGDHREIGEHTLRLDFVDSTGARIGGPDPVAFQFNTPPAPGFPVEFVIGIGILGLNLPEPGNYDFTIRVDDVYLDSIPLYVRDVGDMPKPGKDA